MIIGDVSDKYPVVGSYIAIHDGRGHYGKSRNIVKCYYDSLRRLHCDHGPAKIWDDYSYEHFKHGKIHRVDGPAACEYSFKFNLKQANYTWVICNKIVIENKYKQWITDNGMDLKNLSKEDIAFIELTFSSL